MTTPSNPYSEPAPIPGQYTTTRAPEPTPAGTTSGDVRADARQWLDTWPGPLTLWSGSGNRDQSIPDAHNAAPELVERLLAALDRSSEAIDALRDIDRHVTDVVRSVLDE